MSNLPAYRKTIVALIGAVLTWGSLAIVNGNSDVTTDEWYALIVAIATALGVYSTPNEPKA